MRTEGTGGRPCARSAGPPTLAGVITEVDDALCVLLGRALPEGTMVRLDPPKPTRPTVPPSKSIGLVLVRLHDGPRGQPPGLAGGCYSRRVVPSLSAAPR